MSENVKRKSGKYPYKPTKKEMHIVDSFNGIELLKSYLKVEIGRIEGLIDRDYLDPMTDSDYHYEKGRTEAFRYVLSRLDELSKEEVR